jgi:hypothetical protein
MDRIDRRTAIKVTAASGVALSGGAAQDLLTTTGARAQAAQPRSGAFRHRFRGRQRACGPRRSAHDVVGGIDPSFPVKFLVTFLIVVTIGGSNGIMGALIGSLLLGVLDVAGKYYAPSIGGFIIYAVMVVTLIVRPQGLFARGDAR